MQEKKGASGGENSLWLNAGKALCFEDVLQRFDLSALRGYYRCGALKSWLEHHAESDSRCAEALARMAQAERCPDYPDVTELLRYVFGLRDEIPDFSARNRCCGDSREIIEENYFGSFVYANHASASHKAAGKAETSVIIPGDAADSFAPVSFNASSAQGSLVESGSFGAEASATAEIAPFANETTRRRGGIAADSVLYRYGYGIYLI